MERGGRGVRGEGTLTATSTLRPPCASPPPRPPRPPLPRRFVGEVEIQWRDQIEKVCFPLKPDINYLREGTKTQFTHSVDLR